MKMKTINISLIVGFTAVSMSFTSCYKDKNGPGYEYMPDMYRTESYKAGEFNPNFTDGLTNRPPVDGTIPHSFDPSKVMNNMPYPYTNDEAGRNLAITSLKNPLARSEENVAEGKRLFEIYCAICHGSTGAGDGNVVKILLAKDNYGLKPPAYNGELKSATEGQIFHAMQYGKGNMGSYASQLSVEERWKIVFHVQDLQGNGGGAPTDTTAQK